MNSIEGINLEYKIKLKNAKIRTIITFINSIVFFLIYYYLFPKFNLLTSISFVFMICFFIDALNIYTIKYETRILNNRMKEITKEDKEELEKIILYCKGEYIFTENKIYLLKTNISFMYSDIILIYKKYNFSRYFTGQGRSNIVDSIKYDQSLILILKTNKVVRLLYDSSKIKFFNYSYSSLESFLFSKNKKILVGNSEENFEKVRNEYHINISKDKLRYFG